MDYIHRKSRGRELNESMLNEAVYNMKDVREMWYRKIKLLSDPRKQINLHAKLSKIEPGLRDAELAKILLHNFPGTSPGFINSMIANTFGDPDWLEILNTRFGTDIDMDYLKSCFARMRGPELDQKTLQAIGKKEDAFIKQIESGRGNTKSEEVMKVAASTKRTYIAGSFEEVYELITTRNDFEGRYEKNPDGTISINMADIPLTMVRAMYGLRAVDDSQPLVYIVFGPNGGNDKVIKDHAKQELDMFLKNSHDEKELQEMHIGYYDLRPCGLEYWWTNVSKRFVSKKDNEAVDKVRNSNATLVLSRDGECVLMTEGFESEPEIDPAVNPGNAPVTAPIEDEYGFDSVRESKNNNIRMNRYNRNWARPESARLRRFADMLESMDGNADYGRLYEENEDYDKEFYKSPSELDEIRKKLINFGWKQVGYNDEYVFSMRPYITSSKFNFRYEFAPAKEGFTFQLIASTSDGHYTKDYNVRDGQLVVDRENPNRPIPINTYLPSPGYHKWREYPNFVDMLCDLNWLVAHFGFKMVDGKSVKIPIKNGQLDMFAESFRPSRRFASLFEAKALTPEEKMDRWHNGTRKENIKACNIDKLKEYRKICRAKGYTEQVKIINAELKRRKDEGINEGYNEEVGEPFSILVGIHDPEILHVICAEEDLRTIALAHYYFHKEYKENGEPGICIAKRGFGISESKYDFVFANCFNSGIK